MIQINTEAFSPKLLIHGHSCCEIRLQNLSIVCDPWLVGSAYWRSWWNFPPQSSIDELTSYWSGQDKLFIYLTHLHWDHFHGPTLRKILAACSNVHFLIPFTPERRLLNDLRPFAKNYPLDELVHGRHYRLAADLSVLSFQSGPFFADSALFLNACGYSVLNANDSKLGPFALKSLKSKIGSPLITLRSHSSANWRACKLDLDGSPYPASPDKNNSVYTQEFFSFCKNIGSLYAVPFASNMAYLHPDTFKYNLYSNSSDRVVNSFHPPLSDGNLDDIQPILLLPGESLDLVNMEVSESLWRREMISADRMIVLADYKLSKASLIERESTKYLRSQVDVESIKRYFLRVVKCCPFPLRLYLYDHVFICCISEHSNVYFNIQFYGSKVIASLDAPTPRPRDVLIDVKAHVINDVCRKSHFNSLGVSKMLAIRARPGNSRDAVFNYLCNTVESSGLFDLRAWVSFRYPVVWIRRLPEIADLFLYCLKVFVRRPLSSGKHSPFNG